MASAVNAGAGFFPYTNPRPEYPDAATVLLPMVFQYLRISIGSAVACKLFYSWYLPVAVALKSVLLDSDGLTFTVMISATRTVCWTLIGGFYLLCDRNDWLAEYKFHRKKYQVPTKEMMTDMVQKALFRQWVTGPVFIYGFHYVFTLFGLRAVDAPCPSYTEMITSFILANFFRDFLFYWGHRLLHHPRLYHLHKLHHTFTGPVSICAEYADNFESITTNMLPTLGGVVIFGPMHLVCMVIWIVFRLYSTYESHSGYCFYGTIAHKLGLTVSGVTAFHDFHHTNNRGNFGKWYLDWMFGTMDHWLTMGGPEGYIEKVGFKASRLKSTAKPEAVSRKDQSLFGLSFYPAVVEFLQRFTTTPFFENLVVIKG